MASVSVEVKIIIQVADEEPVCIGSGTIDARTSEECKRELAGLFRQAGRAVEKAWEVDRELDGD